MHQKTSHELVLRAAIDFGSGAIKFQLAFVESSSNRIIKILCRGREGYNCKSKTFQYTFIKER